jgi:hypothetical protein
VPISLDDIEVLLGRELTTPEAARAQRLAELAAGKLSDTHPGFTIEADDETAVINLEATGGFWTPKYPVTAINSLEVDGNTIPAGQYLFDQWGRIRASTTPLNEWELNGWTLGTWAGTATVNYDFGFTTWPDDVTLTVAAMVATAISRQTANPAQIQAETLGAYSVTYGNWSLQQAAEGLTVPTGALRYWKRNRSLSVPLVA